MNEKKYLFPGHAEPLTREQWLQEEQEIEQEGDQGGKQVICFQQNLELK